jgi:hypothetical protein
MQMEYDMSYFEGVLLLIKGTNYYTPEIIAVI